MVMARDINTYKNHCGDLQEQKIQEISREQIESGGIFGVQSIHLPAFWIRVAKWKPSKDEARFLHGV